MIFIDNNGITDPWLNLALEEHLSKNLPTNKDYLFLYRNSPTVVLGRNQNLYEEVDLRLAERENIHIQRRVSGGGAVYHDLGNLNYSFLQKYNTQLIGNWKAIASPIITALQKAGVPAKLNYRNDILVHDKKISGTAQYAGKNLMISHGTLLFESDLDRLFYVLNPTERGEISSQSLKSFRSKVTNVQAFVPAGWGIHDFKTYLHETMASTETYVPTDEDWAAAGKLAQQKYQTWNWTYGRSPAFSIERSTEWQGQSLTMRLEVARGGDIKKLEFSHTDKLWQSLAAELSFYSREAIGEVLSQHFSHTSSSYQHIFQFLYA